MTSGLRLESLSARATNLSLPIGLVVDEVVIEALETHAQLHPFAMDLTHPATVKARVSAANVAAMLEAKSPGGLRNFVVRAEEGILIVEATAKVIVEIRAAVSCTLRVEDGNKLFADLQHVSVPSGVVRGMVEQQLAKVNPLLDLSEIAPSVVIDEAIVEDGFVTLLGRADLPHSE